MASAARSRKGSSSTSGSSSASSPKRPVPVRLPKLKELPERSNGDFARRLGRPVTRDRILYTSHTTFLARWSAP
jgi:hypothetical protein